MTDNMRETIVRMTIKRAMPKWYNWIPPFFGPFSICPLNDVRYVLGVTSRNEAYEFLATLHCMDVWNMTKELRSKLPELIREALAPGREG